ncbi:hypothetical protein AB0D04_38335 [Streptomyces sp. NPDC048483]|uniref:hypothetical protein n=1 Tax=Streptomyces sp. NPDC048483 TaxID=3154927 RepID=UPI00342E9528
MTLPRRSVRLLEQRLAHSTLLRSFVPSEERRKLWLGLSRAGGDRPVRQFDRVAIQRWVQRHAVVGDDGRPLKIHRSRIRTTHEAMRDKGTWTGSGRATIDPNHTPAVEGDHYLTAATPTLQRAVETIVEDAQHDMLRRSHPPMVITEDDAAALAGDYPQLMAALDLDDTVIAELIGGRWTCSRPPAVTSFLGCTVRRASRVRPAPGSACSVRSRSSPRGTRRTCCG